MEVFALCHEFEALESVPEWIQLLPDDDLIKGRDGRFWRNHNPQIVVQYFQSTKQPLPIDYEHATQFKGEKGEMVPAAGWLKELEVRGHGVWGKVEWTERARKMIEAKEYRFISPAFMHNKDGQVTRIIGAALTNRPNLELTALNGENTEEVYSELSRSLGVAVNSPNDVLAALNQQQHSDGLYQAETVVGSYIEQGVFCPAQRDFLVACCQEQGL